MLDLVWNFDDRIKVHSFEELQNFVETILKQYCKP